MNLRTFFNWAQLHDVVPENPFAYDIDKTPTGTFTVMTNVANWLRSQIPLGDTTITLSSAFAVIWCRLMLIPKRRWFCI
jgi:hypothetical protein